MTAHSVRATAALLWGLVAAGAVLGALAFLTRPSRPAETRAEDSRPPTGFAELYVGAFLGAGEGSESMLLPFLADPPKLRGVSSGSMYAARTAAIGVEVVAPRYWSIDVAAEVLGRVGDGYESLGIRVYRVAVLDADGGPVAVTLPSLVTIPTAPAPAPLGLRASAQPRPDDELAAAITGFVTAFLCGDGDVERYVAPGSAVAAVQPPPFRTAEVLSLARSTTEGPVEHVLVVVDGRDVIGRRQQLAYGLVVARRAGRWEVQHIAAPPLRTSNGVGVRPARPIKEKQ